MVVDKAGFDFRPLDGDAQGLIFTMSSPLKSRNEALDHYTTIERCWYVIQCSVVCR